MGVDWCASTWIAVRVPLGSFYKLVRGCGCPKPSLPPANFCPNCGKPTNTVREVPIFGEDWSDTHGGGDLTKNFDVFHHYEGRDVLVGTELAGGTSENVSMWMTTPNQIDFVSIRDRLRQFLEPYGMWDETKFGLWTVLFAS